MLAELVKAAVASSSTASAELPLSLEEEDV